MKIVRTMFAVVLCAVTVGVAQPRVPLFTSDIFSLSSDSVREGRFEAHAISRTQLASTYQSQYVRLTERTITFKFSLNGSDNERMPGQDHHLTIMKDDGHVVSPVFEFGASDPEGASIVVPESDKYLKADTDVLFRVDMRRVLNDFKRNGFFVTVNGEKIAASDFKGVSIAGATYPLTWNFTALPSRPEFALADPDSDGIYTVTIHFKKETYPGRFPDSVRTWTLAQDVSMFPKSESPQLLADALYNMSLEELKLDLRPDGAFMAGEMWPGVWTRDVSYSILLSLAAIAPDASKTTLLAKVKNGRIIQDTGTGGSWPVSSDRTVWALAAWEIFAVTGDRDWLAKAYGIIKASASDDLADIRDAKTGLFRGESSFLDWREQTYPRWMDPKDIYASENLGTNAVHYQTYRILEQMASILGEDKKQYSAIADSIRNGMNRLLWMPDKGYYGQYLYGRNTPMLSPRAEGLGEALTVLFDVADLARQKELVAKTPVSAYGITCIYPQIPNIPPYHNDAVWPFVEAYWGWASAKAENTESVNRSLASVYRAAALYLTNKENLVASTGDFMGTEINSSRQLWSVAGNLAMTYRILYGMTFTPDALVLHPFIPKEYAGERTLTNFKYRKSVLTITVRGYGSGIARATLDGEKMKSPIIPASLTGAHNIVITMNNALPKSPSVNAVPIVVAPETPRATLASPTLVWSRVPKAVRYRVYADGKPVCETSDTLYHIVNTAASHELQVEALDRSGTSSFASEPIAVVPQANTGSINAAHDAAAFTRIDKDSNRTVTLEFTAPESGCYAIDVEYANGNGPINTDNKCAIRTLLIDGNKIGTIVMPQRGEGKWSEWGYSNALTAALGKGVHTLMLDYTPSDANMNQETNTALVKAIRYTILNTNGSNK